jgi:GT2 family glycosyltransferase
LLDQQEGKWEAYDFVKTKLPEIFNNPHIKISKGKNLLHSGGHNKLIQQALDNGAEYYICASNDMLYQPFFVSQLIEELKKLENQKYGIATIKLLQWHKQKLDKVIDSCGIGITKSQYFFDIGQGQIDKGQFDKTRKIFGASGAFIIFRREALEDIEFQGEYFDELLHYKNDVDLAYRLVWAGWKCLFLPNIVAYHDRQLAGENSFFQFFQQRKKTNRFAKESSFFGHLAVLKKNFSASFSWQTKFAIKWNNFKKLIFILLFEPYLLRQFKRIKQCEAELQLKKNSMKFRVEASDVEKMMRS